MTNALAAITPLPGTVIPVSRSGGSMLWSEVSDMGSEVWGLWWFLDEW